MRVVRFNRRMLALVIICFIAWCAFLIVWNIEVLLDEEDTEGIDEDGMWTSMDQRDLVEVLDPKPGELGGAVHVNVDNLTAEEKKQYDDGFENHAFNLFAADKMALDRRLPDVRDKLCIWNYLIETPLVSVIIIFHNEAWSVLLRTVHSVINRSPPALLHEVILVDDYSDMPHLQELLPKYVARWEKVHLLRLGKRMGLVKARIMGTQQASGEVLIFLDSHCECTEGWLPPLLAPIRTDETTVTVPIVDIISDQTMEYLMSQDMEPSIGGFFWSLEFTWQQIPRRIEKHRRSVIDALPTPTMPGGLFAINKAYFLRLGMYDPKLEIWGAENLEISFKIWMCGGRIEIIPCSHVGHIFRDRSPYKWNSETLTKEAIALNNQARVAEVWLDEYKPLFYNSIHSKPNPGDVTVQKELRRRLKCQSFDWYLKNVFPEQFIPTTAKHAGEIRSSVMNMCADKSLDELGSINAYECHGSGGHQMWYLSPEQEIRRENMCWDFFSYHSEDEVQLTPCMDSSSVYRNQKWRYSEDDGHIYHFLRKRCLELTKDGKKMLMKVCDRNNKRQVWSWGKADKQ